MASLHNLTQGLAIVQRGLDNLDKEIRDELSACADIRRQARVDQEKRQQLQAKVEEAKLSLHEQHDENGDLTAILACVQQQTQLASQRRQQKQDLIHQLSSQLAALVDAFEQDSDKFCAAFDKSQMEKRQQCIEQQEHEAAAKVKALQQQLQAKYKQLSQQQAAVKQLREQVVDSKISIKDLKQQIAAESSVGHVLMLELEQAEHEGPTAKQLAKLKADLAEREKEQMTQCCCIAAQEVELGRASADVRQRQQEVTRKKTELAGLNRTIQALGLPPVLQLSMPTAAAPAATSDGTRSAASSGPGHFANTWSNKPAAQAHNMQQTGWQQQMMASSYAQQHGGQQSYLRPAAHHQHQQQQQQQQQQPWVLSLQQPPHWQQYNQSSALAPVSIHTATPVAATTSATAAAGAPQHQQQQQQQYIVEAPDESPGSSQQGNGYQRSSSGPRIPAAAQHRQQQASVQESQECTRLQLVPHQSGTSNRKGGNNASNHNAAAGGRGRARRGRVVVSETVVTTTIAAGRQAPAAVQQQRVVVFEEKGSMASRSGGRMIPASKRTVILEESEHRVTSAASSACGASVCELQHPLARHGTSPHTGTIAAAAAVAPAEAEPLCAGMYPDVYSDEDHKREVDSSAAGQATGVPPSTVYMPVSRQNSHSRPDYSSAVQSNYMREGPCYSHKPLQPAQQQRQHQSQQQQPYPAHLGRHFPSQQPDAGAGPPTDGQMNCSTAGYNLQAQQQQQQQQQVQHSSRAHVPAAGCGKQLPGQQRYQPHVVEGQLQGQQLRARRLQQSMQAPHQHNACHAAGVPMHYQQQQQQQWHQQLPCYPAPQAVLDAGPPLRFHQQQAQLMQLNRHAVQFTSRAEAAQHPAAAAAAIGLSDMHAARYSSEKANAPAAAGCYQGPGFPGGQAGETTHDPAANPGRPRQQQQQHVHPQQQHDVVAVQTPARPVRQQCTSGATGSHMAAGMPGGRKKMSAAATAGVGLAAGAPGVNGGRVTKSAAGAGGKRKGGGSKGSKKAGGKAGRRQVVAASNQDDDGDEFGKGNDW